MFKMNRPLYRPNVWIFFATCVVGSIAFLAYFWSTNLLAGVAVSFAFSAILAWGLVIPMLCVEVNGHWEAGNSWIEDIMKQFLSQEIVDLRLHQLAKALEVLCRKQIRLQGGESALSDLQKLKDEISAAKSAFWTAHELANRLGFQMRHNIRDYALMRATKTAQMG